MARRFHNIVRFVLTPHNPRNVIMWIWYRVLASWVVVFIFRRFFLPHVIRQKRECQQVRVVFLPMNVAMWRYECVYRRMLNDPRFDPVIVTAPRIIQPRESYVREQREMLEYFRSLGHKVIPGFDEKSGRWIRIGDLNPDLIFYTQPYDGLLPTSFEYWHNLRSLVCYTPYSFQFNKVSWNWNNALQNYAWLHLLSLQHHVDICRDFSRIKAENAVPVGYFFEEVFADARKNTMLINSRWQNDSRKRLIWAPHHSITAGASFKTSAFIEICDEMVRLREKYRDRVVFAFKPHPMLKDNLYQRWGKEKTEKYYANWEKSDNSFLDEGDFVSLFAGSDAMIHCSGSFIVDYIYTGKPVQYVYCKDRNTPDFGEIGEAALKAHYPARGVSDIEKFIDEVVLAGNDPMRKQREDVYGRYLKSPNGKTFSENVIEDILVGLGRKSST